MLNKKVTANDTFFRIISVLIAIFLWMYVIGVRNPQVTVTIKSVPVNILNSAQISGRNLKVIEMSEKNMDVKITGRRTDVAQITAEDLNVFVDAKDITGAGEYNLKVSGETNDENVRIASVYPENLKLYIDETITIEKTLEVKLSGELKKEFVAGEPGVEVKNVMIQGPKSIVESVGTAAVTVNVAGAENDVAHISPIELYNLNGDLIDMTYIDLDKKNVSVKLPIYKSKHISVAVDASDGDKEKYTFAVQPAEINIYGAKSIIDGINEIKTEELKISGPGVYKLGIKVPENVYLSDDITTVSVTATVRE